ncbi:hypothetical protein [Sphingomicrobium nitratireducens]|uniref:hypothetical protein n=1 Tax=Sphingomicrobium nitratireducens TaxID=2964666 RepID=UPI00224050B8|nr:hypothetical protein [Sphingomicrobium nitratireducens]
MTNDDSMTGEQRLAARRARFWKTILAAMAVSSIAGFATGVGAGRGGLDLLTSPVFAIAAVLVGVVGLVVTSIWFYRSVDELETADNLWASLYGLYFYIAALPAWWLLEKAGLVPAVNHWAIYAATLVFTVLVYGWRKLAAR